MGAAIACKQGAEEDKVKVSCLEIQATGRGLLGADGDASVGRVHDVNVKLFEAGKFTGREREVDLLVRWIYGKTLVTSRFRAWMDCLGSAHSLELGSFVSAEVYDFLCRSTAWSRCQHQALPWPIRSFRSTR